MIETLFHWLLSDSVRDNTIVTLVIGGPLSVYLAIIVNRLASFRQIKFSALMEVALLQKTTLDTDSCLKARIAMRAFLEVPVAALVEDRQKDVANVLFELRKNLRRYFLDEFDVEMAKREHTKYAQLCGDEWVEAQSDIYNRAHGVIRDAVRRIQKLRPDYGQILMFTPSSRRWFRTSDCAETFESRNPTI
jgi:hypothetical protein